MTEEWRDIVGSDGYQVSSYGFVRSPQNLLRMSLSSGYWSVRVRFSGLLERIRVHRLVAEAFIHKPDYAQVVNHLDGNKLNNHKGNLEWTTHKENIRHGYAMKLNRPRWRPIIGVSPDGRGFFFANMSLAEKYGFSRNAIGAACHGRLKTSGGMEWQYADAKGVRKNVRRRSPKSEKTVESH